MKTKGGGWKQKHGTTSRCGVFVIERKEEWKKEKEKKKMKKKKSIHVSMLRATGLVHGCSEACVRRLSTASSSPSPDASCGNEVAAATTISIVIITGGVLAVMG